MFFPAFNPFTFWSSTLASRPVYPRQPSLPAGTPIEIRATASDLGISIRLDPKRERITLRGTTQGPEAARDLFGPNGAAYARGMSFTLDIERAPTVDVFGRTNYTEKNSRIFTLMTQKGWSASKCAEMLAAKVNRGDDFRAEVEPGHEGAVSIRFLRR